MPLSGVAVISVKISADAFFNFFTDFLNHSTEFVGQFNTAHMFGPRCSLK